MKILSTIKSTIVIALTLCSLHHFASASYISEGDEIGDIAARYGVREQVAGIPSLKVDFDKFFTLNEEMKKQYKQAYINKNNIHHKVVCNNSMNKTLNSIADDVFCLQLNQFHIKKICQIANINEDNIILETFKQNFPYTLQQISIINTILRGISRCYYDLEEEQKINDKQDNCEIDLS